LGVCLNRGYLHAQPYTRNAEPGHSQRRRHAVDDAAPTPQRTMRADGVAGKVGASRRRRERDPSDGTWRARGRGFHACGTMEAQHARTRLAPGRSAFGSPRTRQQPADKVTSRGPSGITLSIVANGGRNMGPNRRCCADVCCSANRRCLADLRYQVLKAHAWKTIPARLTL
jgi:hypothetical protein